MRAKSSKQRCPALCFKRAVAVPAPNNDVMEIKQPNTNKQNSIPATLLNKAIQPTAQRLRSRAG